MASRYETVWKDGKTQSAHKVVWESLHDPVPEGMTINHIDGDKWNNDPSNLELVTRSKNQLHAYETGLQKYKFPAEVVEQVKPMRDSGMTFTAIGKELGMTRQYAWQIYNDIWRSKKYE